jgi:hypothetical protein
MPQSPTASQMKTFRRYFTESWEIFTANAIITDVFTNGFIPSIFHWELKNIYFICHYHRRNISVGIFPGGIFFGTHFSSLKPSVVFFFTDRSSDKMWNYRRKLCQRTHSVGNLVGKKITDEVVISHRRIFSVSKTVKCCSAPTSFPIILIQEDDLLRRRTCITRLLGLSSYIEKKFNKKKHTHENEQGVT